MRVYDEEPVLQVLKESVLLRKGCWGPWVGQLHALHMTSISETLSSERWPALQVRGLLQAYTTGDRGCKGWQVSLKGSVQPILP